MAKDIINPYLLQAYNDDINRRANPPLSADASGQQLADQMGGTVVAPKQEPSDQMKDPELHPLRNDPNYDEHILRNDPNYDPHSLRNNPNPNARDIRNKTSQELREERQAQNDAIAKDVKERAGKPSGPVSDRPAPQDGQSSGLQTTAPAQSGGFAKGTPSPTDSTGQIDPSTHPSQPAPQNISWQERSAIMRAARSSGKYSQSERQDLFRSLRRIQGAIPGEAPTAQDYARLQNMLYDSPWQTITQKKNGGVSVNQSSGGRQANNAIENILRRASIPAAVVISEGKYGGSSDLSEQITNASGVPGAVVLDYMAQKEAMRAMAMGIQDPSQNPIQFPAISAMRQATMNDIATMNNAAEMKKYEEMKLIDARIQLKVDEINRYNKLGILPAEYQQYSSWVLRNMPGGTDPEDPKTAQVYLAHKRKGEIDGVIINDDGTTSIGKAPDAQDVWDQNAPSTGTMSRMTKSPERSIAEYDREIAASGKQLTVSDYIEGAVKKLAEDNPGVSSHTLQREGGAVVQKSAEQHYNRMSNDELVILRQSAQEAGDQIDRRIRDAQGSVSNLIDVRMDDHSTGRMMSADEIYNGFVQDYLDQAGADGDFRNAVIAGIDANGSESRDVQDFIGTMNNRFREAYDAAASEYAAQGRKNEGGAAHIFSNTELYVNGVPSGASINASGFIKDPNAPKDSAKFVPMVGKVSDEDQKILDGLMAYANTGSDPIGLKKDFDAALAAGERKDAVFSFAFAGSQNPETVSVYDANQIVDYLKTRANVMRIPTKVEIDNIGDSYKELLGKINDTAFDTLQAPQSTLRNIKTDPSEGDKLLDDATRIAGDLGKLKDTEREGAVAKLLIDAGMFDGGKLGSILSSAMKFTSLPQYGLNRLGKEKLSENESFLSNIVTNDSPESLAIRNGLKSDDSSERLKAIALILSEVDRRTATMIDAPMVAVASLGANAGGSNYADLALSGADVSGFVMNRTSKVEDPVPSNQMGSVTTQAAMALNGIVASYNHLSGGDPEAGAIMRNAYLPSLNALRNQMKAQMDWRDKQGWPVSKDQRDALSMLDSAVDNLSVDPEQKYVHRQLSLIKMDIERGIFPEELDRYGREISKQYGVDWENVPLADLRIFSFKNAEGNPETAFGNQIDPFDKNALLGHAAFQRSDIARQLIGDRRVGGLPSYTPAVSSRNSFSVQ